MHLYLFAAIVAFAFNLRPGLVAIGPLLPDVGRALALSPFALGVLTALPVLALGTGSAFAERLGRRLGWGRAIIVTALAIAAGIALRSTGAGDWVFAGAALLGFGTGLGGVYIPALMKANSARLGVAMGAYTFMLVVSSTISVGTTPALFRAFGNDWRPALAVWALPALLALVLWLPLRRVDIPPKVGGTALRLWRSPLAWGVALNMGMQSTLFYSLASWLATLLIARGVSVAAAGLDLSLFYLPQIVTSLVAPLLLARTRRQGLAAALVVAFGGVMIVGALYGPIPLIPLFCALLGSALGAVFACALSFLVLRSRSAHTAAALSAMAQTVGYVAAASGPLVLGALRALPDPRLASFLWMSALIAGAIAAGLVAGRQAFVDP